MSDESSPQLVVNPDPMATADNLFVSPSSATDDTPASTGSATQEVMQIAELAGKRFAIRANNQDHVLTHDELLTAAQKGMNYDKLTSDYGTAKQKLEPSANNWDQFQQGMIANAGVTLATYANPLGLTVGIVNDQGMFEAVDMNAPGNFAGESQSSSPEVEALSTEVSELKTMLADFVGGVQNTQEEQALMEKHKASPDEVKAAKQIVADRNLPSGSLDVALALVRQNSPVAPAAAPIPVQAGTEGMSTQEAILQLMKANDPSLTGGGFGETSVAKVPYLDMTPQERTQAAWEEAKREAGITSL